MRQVSVTLTLVAILAAHLLVPSAVTVLPACCVDGVPCAVHAEQEKKCPNCGEHSSSFNNAIRAANCCEPITLQLRHEPPAPSHVARAVQTPVHSDDTPDTQPVPVAVVAVPVQLELLAELAARPPTGREILARQSRLNI